MIVAVVAEKGGVGKTMVATNLAGMRASCGRRDGGPGPRGVPVLAHARTDSGRIPPRDDRGTEEMLSLYEEVFNERHPAAVPEPSGETAQVTGGAR